MRSYARETAFCKVYTYIMSGVFDEDFSQFDSEKLTEEDVAFATGLVKSVIEHKKQLDEQVSMLAVAYKLQRIYRIDLAVIELAMCEMQYFDTPHPVVINEAVTIVKKYSTEKSVSFVNGILAEYERKNK